MNHAKIEKVYHEYGIYKAGQGKNPKDSSVTAKREEKS